MLVKKTRIQQELLVIVTKNVHLLQKCSHNYDYTSVVKKIEELIVNGVIDQNYKINKINNPETESDKNQPQEDARESDQTSSNISILSIPIQHDTLPDITPTSPTLTSTDHQQNKPKDSENPNFSTTIMQPSQLLTPTAENEAYHNYNTFSAK